MAKDKPVIEEDKPLPAHLLAKLSGKPVEQKGEDKTSSEEEAPAAENDETKEKEAGEKSETPKEKAAPSPQQTSRRLQKKEKSEAAAAAEGAPRQLNFKVRRRYFRSSQTLLTDLKLFADEELDRTVSMGSLFEVLVEIGKNLQNDDPDEYEKIIRKVLGK